MGEEVKKVEKEAKPPTGEESKDPPPSPPPSPPPPPPPPPQDVVLKVLMHCEGCAKKVRRCLKGFEGVETVVTDCKSHKVVVKGEKVDPMKVLERVQKKSNRKVELLSPVPKPLAEEPKKLEQEEPPKPEEKKNEPMQVITVDLKVHMHCEACAQEIRKRILKMKGVESAVPDFTNSRVAVKGSFSAAELVNFVYKRTGKQAVIMNQDLSEIEEDAGEEKKADEGGEKQEEVAQPNDMTPEKQEEVAQPNDMTPEMLEMKKSEYYYYYYQPANYRLYSPRYVAEASYAYPPTPEMFSDENPNACGVM